MRRFISSVLVAAIFTLSTHSVQAKVDLLPTLEVIKEITPIRERADLVVFMGSAEVQKEMIRNGVDPQEALARVAALSEEELRNLSSQISNAQAGGDLGFGSIVGAAVFVFIVLLITDILGFTKFFSFTRSIRN